VDCAPLVPVYAKIALLMGGSLAALRMLWVLGQATCQQQEMLVYWILDCFKV
jgi:hypothetical protein